MAKSEVNCKVALVTGASKRIGNGIARKFHEEGYNIVLHYNMSSKDALFLAEELNKKRENSCFPIQFDLGNFHEYENFKDQLGDDWKKINVLINNASTFYPTNFIDSNEDNWDDLININLKCPFFLSQLFYKELKDNNGSIINIVDIHSLKPLKDFPIYSIAKSGLNMLTRSLAIELGPEIRVNGVSPGPILWPEVKEYENTHQEIIDSTALKRQGDISDIANLCFYLQSKGVYITGQVINVDGGRSLGL